VHSCRPSSGLYFPVSHEVQRPFFHVKPAAHVHVSLFAISGYEHVSIRPSKSDILRSSLRKMAAEGGEKRSVKPTARSTDTCDDVADVTPKRRECFILYDNVI